MKASCALSTKEHHNICVRWMVTSLPLLPRYYLISTLRFMVPQQAETPIDFSDQTKEPPRP